MSYRSATLVCADSFVAVVSEAVLCTKSRHLCFVTALSYLLAWTIPAAVGLHDG